MIFLPQFHRSKHIQDMKYNKRFYISRNYKAQASAAGKAKIDCETSMREAGFQNLGLPQSSFVNPVANFAITLVSTILGLIRLPYGSVLCVQYPTKKYYNFIVHVAKLKQCKVITVIHDLRSHRKQKVAIKKEIECLNKSNVVVSHNACMSRWLRENELNSKLVNLGIFDFYCEIDRQQTMGLSVRKQYSLVFAGVLEKRKNGFIYALDQLPDQGFSFNLYGVGFKQNQVTSDSIINYKGVFPATEIANRVEGDFGLVWDGTSLDMCAGSFGEYLKINNPHKTSMYLRAGLPVIVWDQAAIAKFVVEYNAGITVSSLKDIDTALRQLSCEDYQQMKANAESISRKIGSGFYFKTALEKALSH